MEKLYSEQIGAWKFCIWLEYSFSMRQSAQIDARKSCILHTNTYFPCIYLGLVSVSINSSLTPLTYKKKVSYFWKNSIECNWIWTWDTSFLIWLCYQLSYQDLLENGLFICTMYRHSNCCKPRVYLKKVSFFKTSKLLENSRPGLLFPVELLETSNPLKIWYMWLDYT